MCVVAKGLGAVSAPQRQRRARVTRSTVRPVPLMISRLPVTTSGPFFCGETSSGPSRAASGVTLRVSGSPVAIKPIVVVRTVAIRLVLRGPAAAERGPEAAAFAGDRQSARERHMGRFRERAARLTGGACSSRPPSLRVKVMAPDGQFERDIDEILDRHAVGVDPLARRVGLEHGRCIENAEARMDATAGRESGS